MLCYKHNAELKIVFLCGRLSSKRCITIRKYHYRKRIPTKKKSNKTYTRKKNSQTKQWSCSEKKLLQGSSREVT